jgi:hypothetical protein
MQEMVQESLSGTQARQLFLNEKQQTKVKRVDPRFLEVEVEQLKVGDISVLLRELRRVVTALDERGGFMDE